MSEQAEPQRTRSGHNGLDPAYEVLDESIPEEFHFHFYFTPETRDSALDIRRALVEEAEFTYQLPPVREQPMGPHRWPIWSIWVDKPNFTAATLWMMRHHGAHSVLVHPETGDSSGYKDHTAHAMWLGTPVPLNLGVFRSR